MKTGAGFGSLWQQPLQTVGWLDRGGPHRAAMSEISHHPSGWQELTRRLREGETLLNKAARYSTGQVPLNIQTQDKKAETTKL